MREVTKFAKGGPLQNLLRPFASIVRRENKFRVFFLFCVRNFRTFTVFEYLPNVMGGGGGAGGGETIVVSCKNIFGFGLLAN